MNFRIGHGYDVHRLAEKGETGEKLTLRLGGVTIPHSKGCVAHSDGDAVIHALCDALLGAAALGDIGLHFPDTAGEFRGIDSRELLRRTVALVRGAGWEVGNVDCTIMLQAPKVRPYIDAMRSELAAAMGVDVSAVSVKATTTERLGFVGREEGVAAEAVVLIENKDNLDSIQIIEK
jgi:2-C-methyl-D-erythritol 2,4-cyclodiphosphate synthase